MKVECTDLMDPRLVCVGTISRVVGRLLKVADYQKILLNAAACEGIISFAIQGCIWVLWWYFDFKY
jgi:hypothetical protein